MKLTTLFIVLIVIAFVGFRVFKFIKKRRATTKAKSEGRDVKLIAPVTLPGEQYRATPNTKASAAPEGAGPEPPKAGPEPSPSKPPRRAIKRQRKQQQQPQPSLDDELEGFLGQMQHDEKTLRSRRAAGREKAQDDPDAATSYPV